MFFYGFLNRIGRGIVVFAIALSFFWGTTAPVVLAQQIIPHPDASFTGKIGLTYEDSEEVVPQLKIPQNFGVENPPNIFLIMLDDVGYGQMGTFGSSVIKTPAMDELAANGLKYTQFHTTALCAPTRAALLTGHNHHAAGTGIITRLATGFPGYDSEIPLDSATFAQTLQAYGYGTAWFGKTHNVPDVATSIAGPYDQWPTHMGFDYFYGFVGGDTDQFFPALVENTTRLEAPANNADGSPYHLTTDMADHAISYIRETKAALPGKPFFVYFAPGATHAPHQVPQSYVEKYQGLFDEGWDAYRTNTFQNQLDLGVVPEGTLLTPMPKDVGFQAWDTLTPEQQAVYANMMEVFAAFTDHTDEQIGRVIDAIADLGPEEFNNTLIIYIAGDNGSSAEGQIEGLLNEISFFNQISEPFEDKVAVLEHNVQDDPLYLGGPMYFNHFPANWAWAMDTPLQWTKQAASHFGGVRNGMVISWPDRITDLGDVRYQFSHVTDIAPTIYEAIGIPAPVTVNGVTQKPLEGASLVYTFDAVDADGNDLGDVKASTHHNTQYFEMFGNQGIYHDGWMASALRRVPWVIDEGNVDLLDLDWELYDITSDFSQANNLADDGIPEYDQKLEEMKYLFFAEAGRYGVLPLDDRQAERQLPGHRPDLTEGRTKIAYPAGYQSPEGTVLNLKNKNHTIVADVTFDPFDSEDPDEGMLVTLGGRFGGFGLFVKDAQLVYYYNYAAIDDQSSRIAGNLPSDIGPITSLKAVYQSDDEDLLYAGATVSLYASSDTTTDKLVAQGSVTASLPYRMTQDENFVVGFDTQTPVTEEYVNDMPFTFTGTLNNLTIELDESNSPLPDLPVRNEEFWDSIIQEVIRR
ncbi:MAG: arylsulfatase [Symploca sp. SIO2D2]|nr:arylsulfatase [Symploca sp. SIO2D2]